MGTSLNTVFLFVCYDRFEVASRQITISFQCIYLNLKAGQDCDDYDKIKVENLRFLPRSFNCIENSRYELLFAANRCSYNN